MMSSNVENAPLFHRALSHSTASWDSASETVYVFDRRWILVVLMVGAAVTAGCGGSSGIAPVHGVVTLDGKPLTEGFVFVTPAEGKMAKGSIQPDGTFVLGTDSDSDGAQVGTHPVTVLPPTAEEGKPLSAVAKSLPRRYSIAQTSGITVDVKPNTDNELTIELSTR